MSFPAVNREQIKVCDIVQSYGEVSGGVKRYVHDKMEYVSDRQDKIAHVLIIPGEECNERREHGSRIYTVTSPPIPGSKGYRFLLNAERMMEIIRTESPDIIEVGNAYWPAWVSIKAGKSNNIPVVGFYHSDFPRAVGDKLSSMLKASGVGEIVTDTMEAYLAGLYNQMTAVVTATRRFQVMLEKMGIDNVVRIPLGTDTQVFKPTASAREDIFAELDLDENTFLLLYAGRFAGMKNIPKLIRMMAYLHDAPKPVHLVLMGDGEYEEEVLNAQRRRDDITRMPYCTDPKQLAKWYTAADLFVNPGTRETFGLVAVEAQACGTRVLGVKDGGMDEVLEGEAPLIMAESQHPDHLAQAVKTVIDLDEDEQTERKRRRRIETHFSIEKNFDTLFNLYRRLSSKP